LETPIAFLLIRQVGELRLRGLERRLVVAQLKEIADNKQPYCMDTKEMKIEEDGGSGMQTKMVRSATIALIISTRLVRALNAHSPTCQIDDSKSDSESDSDSDGGDDGQETDSDSDDD
jgi:hypothetical protein